MHALGTGGFGSRNIYSVISKIFFRASSCVKQTTVTICVFCVRAYMVYRILIEIAHVCLENVACELTALCWVLIGLLCDYIHEHI